MKTQINSGENSLGKNSLSEDFQRLLREADNYAGIFHSTKFRVPISKHRNTNPREVDPPEKEWWKKIKCYEDDINLLKTNALQIHIPRTSFSRNYRRINRSSKVPHSTSMQEPWEKYVLFSQDWENNIIWGETEELNEYYTNASTTSNNNNNVDGDIYIAVNPEMYSGSWIENIIWDDEVVNMSVDDNNQITYDIDINNKIPLVFHHEDSWLVLKPERINIPTIIENSKYNHIKLSSIDTNIDQLPIHQISNFDNTHNNNNNNIPLHSHISAGYIRRVKKQLKNEKLKTERMKDIKAIGITGASVLSSLQTNKRPRDELLIKARRRRYALPTVDHSDISLRHQLVKCDMKTSELRFFHHPKLPKKIHGLIWSMISNRFYRHISKPNSQEQSMVVDDEVNMSSNSNSYNNRNQYIDKEDLNITSGDFICIEYVERHPHIINNIGMGIRILNFYRNSNKNENDDIDPDNINNNNDEDKNNINNNIQRIENKRKKLLESIHRVPKHLEYIYNVEKRKSLDLQIEVDIEIPKLPEGQTIILEEDEDSPFLGDIEKGTMLPTIYSNIYQAPLFQHTSNTYDYILIRVPRSKTNLNNNINTGVSFLIRKIPHNRIYLCGQQEPQKVVPKPTKKISKIQEDWILFQLSKYFDNIGDLEVDFENILDIFPNSKFKIADFKKILSKSAIEIQNNLWKRRPAEQLPPVEELETKLKPEDVCLQESCYAAEVRLKDFGINFLNDTTKVESWLEVMVNWRNFCNKRARSMCDLASQFHGTQRGITLHELSKILTRDVQHIQRKIDIGRAIIERLKFASWMATEAFVRAHVERAIAGTGTGMLELTGSGDPSGIGEGFAYVRKTKQSQDRRKGHLLDIQSTSSLDSNSNISTLFNTQISSTNRDLRKLPKKEARAMLVCMGMDINDVANLKRWDLIAMIRSMATKAEEVGTAEELHKYARASSNKQLTMQEMMDEYKKTCQAIWERQYHALSNTIPYIEDDDVDEKDDDDDDFDSLTKEVEEAMRAGGGGTTMNSITGGIQNNSNMGDKDEDEERRALKELKTDTTTTKSSSVSNTSATPIIPLSTTSTTSIPNNRVYPKQVVKQIIRKVAEDGKETIEITYIFDTHEIHRVDAETSLEEARRLKFRNKGLARTSNRNNEEISGSGNGLGIGGGGLGGSDDERDGDKSKEMKLQLGRYKNIADEHKRGLEKEDGVYNYKTNYRALGGSLKRSGHSTRSMRLPLVVFSLKLESIVLDLWRKRIAPNFHYLVDIIQYPDYYKLIKHPISLNEIRNNVAKGYYKSTKTFLADIYRMAENAQIFNGPDSIISDNAFALYKTAYDLINIEKDTFEEYESDIKAKFSSLGRSVTDTATLAAPPNPSQINTNTNIFRANTNPNTSYHSKSAKSTSNTTSNTNNNNNIKNSTTTTTKSNKKKTSINKVSNVITSVIDELPMIIDEIDKQNSNNIQDNSIYNIDDKMDIVQNNTNTDNNFLGTKSMFDDVGGDFGDFLGIIDDESDLGFLYEDNNNTTAITTTTKPISIHNNTTNNNNNIDDDSSGEEEVIDEG